MKPQKKEVLQAIKVILREKKCYSIQDIVSYVNSHGGNTNRREVISVIIKIIQGDKKISK